MNTALGLKPRDLSAIPDGYCYVLDASAVLRDPAIEAYKGSYGHLRFVQPAVYLLSTVLLDEVDKGKNTRDGAANHGEFMDRLRRWGKTTRLSKAPSMDGTPDGDKVMFLRAKIEDIDRPELSWLDARYGDRHILAMALELKKAGRKVAVISRDSLIGVLCKEFNLPHKFLEPERIPSSTTGPSKIDLNT